MNWADVPWGAIVTAIIAIVGFIAWLVRLEGKAAKTADNLKDHKEDTREKVGLVTTKIGLVEGDVRELQITRITRDDMKDLKQELTASINAVGDRTIEEVERLVQVMNKRSAPRPRLPKSGS